MFEPLRTKKNVKIKCSVQVLFGIIQQEPTYKNIYGLFWGNIALESWKNYKPFKELDAFLVRFVDIEAILRLPKHGYSNIDISCYNWKFKNADKEIGEKSMLYSDLLVLNRKNNYRMVPKP